MRIVNEPIENKTFRKKMEKYFYEIKKFDNLDFSVPEEYKNVTLISTKILVGIFFWLIIPLIWFFSKRKKLKKILNDRVKIDIKLEDYNNYLKQGDTYFNHVNVKEGVIDELVSKRNSAVARFHYGSIIDSELWSDVYEIEFYNNYLAFNQKVIIKYHYYVTESYTDSKGNRRTRTVRHDRSWKEAIAIVKTDFFRDQNTYITSNIKYKELKRHKLENSQFNRTYKVYTNNEVQANMVFTPYAQELLVKKKSGSFTKFEMSDDTLIAWGLFFGGIKLTDDIKYSISDMRKGIEEIKKISFNLWAKPIFRLNNLYNSLLILPIWDVKS